MPKLTVNQISFNHRQDLFVIASDDGIRIFLVNPLKELRHLQPSAVGSVRIATVLDQTNYVAFVSGNPRPKYAFNVVIIHCLKLDIPLAEITFNSPVQNISISLSHLVVVLRKQVHVFDTHSFKYTCSEETGDNAYSLVAVSPDSKNDIMVYPGRQQGTVSIVNIQRASQNVSQAPSVIRAHCTPIVRLALNNSATILATGSKSGTNVKMFNTKTFQQIYELHRGLEPGVLHSMRFSCDSDFFVLCSDRGTIHVYNFVPSAQTNYKGRITSVRKFNLPEPGVITECAFANSMLTSNKSKLCNDVIIVGYNATYMRYIESNANVDSYELLFDLTSGFEMVRM